MSVIDELVVNNVRYATSFAAATSSRPARHLAVLTCMDARLDVHALLGLTAGDVHVIRNAGGVVTDDAVRSLAISQRFLGTTDVMLVQHTDCGMLTFTDEQFSGELEAETGGRPSWSAGAFSDLDDSVRSSIAALRATPFLPRMQVVRGFVFDVHSGLLREVAGG